MNDEVDESGPEVLARVGETLSASVDGLRRSVVDAPVFAVHEIDGRKVITAASVSYSGGFGFGGGGGSAGEVHTIGAPADQGPGGSGGGGGGGGTGEGRPVAVIDVSGGEVRIHPVVDWTKVGAAVIAALVTMWMAARRGRRG